MLLLSIVGLLLGVFMGLFSTFLFGKFPESWLQDYGYDPKAPGFRIAKRMKYVPHGIIAVFFCALMYIAAVNIEIFYSSFNPFHLAMIAFAVPVLFLVLMADKLNRIIPDQFSVYLFACGLIGLAGDLIYNSMWFSNDIVWYYVLINRLGAAILGGGVLFLIEFICETFVGKTGMGQGDMKLLAACGMLTGIYGLVFVIYVAVILAVFFAVPLLIKKNKRISNEEKEISQSPNPASKRRELEIKKANIHYADDPDYLAFGPFLSLGTAIFICLEPLIARLAIPTIVSFGVYF